MGGGGGGGGVGAGRGGGHRVGGQEGCERRSKVFVKIQKKKNFEGGGSGLGGGSRGGWGGGRIGWGVRVDQELGWGRWG